MGKVSSNLVRIWLDHYDLSGYLNSAEQSLNIPLADVRCFGDEGPKRAVLDLPDHDHSVGGLYDHESGVASHDAEFWQGIYTNAASNHYLAKSFGGNVRGAVCYDAVVNLSEMPWGLAMGAAQTLGRAAQGSDNIGRGVILEPKGAITGNGNRTGVNQGATVAGQVYAVTFRVFSENVVTFDWKIQQSQNDGGADPYADVAGLTGTVTVVGVTRVTTILATEAWKRLVIANWNGVTATVSCTGVALPVLA